MSYTTLYRKFRPERFEDVQGQEHIVTTLQNQIKANRIGHAYLFCGTRGTGKTSVAKIFAKAVNCLQPKGQSPCGECALCKAISQGASMNVIEIDAASNNGVDNIREIREEVSYPPTEGNYKVYIIDEVHMLSIGAFNALLKTLEEPPSYVIFILATTEVHKIPITIVSRCQRYDFKRISVETIAAHLQNLLEKEQIAAEEKALTYVAKMGDGSMRDALSLLEQCISYHFGETLTYEMVLEVLGAVDTEVYEALLTVILEGNVAGAIRAVEEVLLQGRELSQFVTDFIWYLRNLLLLQISADAEEVLAVSKERLAAMREQAVKVDPGAIMRYIRLLSELSNQLRGATQKRVLLEVALMKLCKPQMETDVDSLRERIRRLEHIIEQGQLTAVSGVQTPTANTDRSAPERTDARQPETGTQQGEAEGTAASGKRLPEKAAPQEVLEVVNNWEQICSRIPAPEGMYIQAHKPKMDESNRIVVLFSADEALIYGFVKDMFDNGTVETAISECIGKQVECCIRLNEAGRVANDVFDIRTVDFSGVHMQIEEEDE